MNTKLTVGCVLLAVVVACYWWRGDHFDRKSIAHQRILVTGASSGIGEELAYQYAKLGARLVITARREPLLKEVVKKCQDLGAEQVDAFPADMAKPEDRDQLIEFTRKTLGGLDQLILNHASLRHKFWMGDTEDLNLLRQDMEVNFISFVDLTSKALPLLKEVKGRIGVVSSVLGKMGMMGSSHYSSSKFALHGFFTSLRQELEFEDSGVSVTILVLGFIRTDAALRVVAQQPGGENVPFTPVSASDAALAILKDVNNRILNSYYPFITSSVVLTFQQLFPEFTEYIFVKLTPKN